MFLGDFKIDRQTVHATLMVTTSYEEAVLAGAAFFVLATRCGRYVTCVNLIKSTIVRLWLSVAVILPLPWLLQEQPMVQGRILLQLMPYHRRFPFLGTLLSKPLQITFSMLSSPCKQNCQTEHLLICRATIICIIDNSIFILRPLRGHNPTIYVYYNKCFNNSQTYIL